jgi:hypothetical protein
MLPDTGFNLLFQISDILIKIISGQYMPYGATKSVVG